MPIYRLKSAWGIKGIIYGISKLSSRKKERNLLGLTNFKNNNNSN